MAQGFSYFTRFLREDNNFQDPIINNLNPNNPSYPYAAILSAWLNAAGVLPGGDLNKFRNGTFDIAQRSTSGTVAAGTSAYTLDGWIIGATGAGCAWSQVFATNTTGSNLNLVCASGLTDVTLTQRIESYIAALLNPTDGGSNTTVTVQFFIRNLGTGASITPVLTASSANAQDNFGAITTIVSANLQTVANNGEAVCAYTFQVGYAIHNGLQITLDFGTGLNHASGSVVVAMADIRLTPGATVGLNNSPPPPELRPIPFELMFCQRYLPAWNWKNANDNIGFGYSNTTISYVEIAIAVTPRIAPTGLNVTGTGNMVIRDGSNVGHTVNSISSNVFSSGTNQQVAVNTTDSLTVGQGCFVFANAAAQILFTGCEL